jgi:SNW domain-containing protein 1
MGQEKPASANTKTIALQYDSEGKLRHDAVARIGHGKDKVVHTRLSEMKSKVIDEEDDSLKRAEESEVQQTTEITRQALEKILRTG